MKVEERIKEIFAQALEKKSLAEREKYLAEACQGEPELRQQVESLLRAHEQAGDFLGRTVPLPQPDFTLECTGTIIGRYKLLERIGEGGFGVVWMAEQEEPVRRRVALKIIKLGMDTKEVVARFEAERQALAMMEHPNIAIVFDGGATNTGRPYFVMELVKGIPITDYCDVNKLGTRERLELFMQVCHAVQHAHQKGVIHRDLKPSNILVTVKDDQPVPKVIDFGVAKATQALLTEKTVFTRFHQWIGTPAYMSPEQAGLGSLDVDTRSDVYSLGVLLYELLTGRTPFDTQKLLAAGYDAVMRTIREEEPPKPSTRLSTLKKEELSTVAAKRGAEPAKLNRLVHGDLDWIVMKALEKDRRRRYESASAFASDVQASLRQEPVIAAPPTMGYLVVKFSRRHRAALASAAALLTILLAATGASLWQWRNAVQARTLAQHFAADAREKLRLSYLDQARASLLTSTAGRRFNTLEAVRLSVGIKTSIAARNEAASALALPDLRVAREWEGNPPGTSLLALDASGTRYARSSGDGTVSVRSVMDDKEIWHFPGRGGSVDWVLRFSPDDRYLVATDSHPTERHLRAWNLTNGTVALDIPLVAHGAAFDFQPRSTIVAVADEPGTLHWFDLADDRRWAWETKLKNPYALRFRGDGAQLAVSSLDQPGVSIFESESGRLVAELPHPAGVRFLDWSADGQRLAAPCADGNIYVWDVSGTPRLNRVFKGHDAAVSWVAFHPTGDLLVSSSWDGTTALWSPANGYRWCHWPGNMHQFSLSSNGRWLGLLAAGSKVQLLELEPAGEFHWLAASANRSAVGGDFSPDGKWLATGNSDGVTLWDTASWRRVLQKPTGPVKYLSFCPNGKSLFVVGNEKVSEWPLSLDQKGMPELGESRPLDVGPPFAMCSSSDDGTIVAVARNGVWVEDRRRSKSFYLTEWPQCNEVAVSPDGRWVAGRKWGTTELHVWQLSEKKEVKVLTAYNGQVGFSPDGRWLIAGTDTAFYCWEVGTWREVNASPRDDSGSRGVPRLAIAHDNKWMAIEKAHDLVQVVALPTFEPVVTLRSIPGHPVSFSPDKSQLLMQTGDGSLGVWELRRINQELGRMGLGWQD